MKAAILAVAAATAFTAANSRAQTSTQAVFTGVVLDSLRRPIGNADVALPGLAISRTTNDKGTFWIGGISTGVHRVVIRAIGYGQLDTTIAFPGADTVQRRITLGRITTLDSMFVNSSTADPALMEFEEHKMRGFGQFVGPDAVKRNDGQDLSNLINQLNGLSLIRGRNGQSWPTSRRTPMSHCPIISHNIYPAQERAAQDYVDRCLKSEGIYYVPVGIEAQQGIIRTCYARVYLDKAVMNPGVPAFPFDVNSIATVSIIAIEWFGSDHEVPPAYYGRDAKCGLLVLHSRRP